MTLLIDTTNREKLIIGLFEKGNLSCFEFDTLKQSEEILPAIEGVLKKEKISLQKIENILVNQGPGSYTGVRVGVTVANALGWSLNIPVFGYKEGELDSTLLKIAKLKIKNFEKIVLPLYLKK